jgi:hypothetical protein
VRSAPGDNPSNTGDVVLERTATQTLWWFLGHRATIAVVASVLAAALIAASAGAAKSGPATIDGTATPSSATEPAGVTGATEATIVLTCPAAAQLTLTATGTGVLELTVDGPAQAHATAPEIVAASVSGPSGTYTAHAGATVRVDRVSWTSTGGACRG